MRSPPGWFARRVLRPCLTALGVRTTHTTATPEGPGVALLIDGENCSPELAAKALAEAGKFGVVRVRRVYANWASANHRGWMDVVARCHLEPIHHARTATGKNATDIALVVDAMDLLHTGEIACFCLVASDSDYTPLVQRLRAANRIVIGLGRAQTTSALVEACSLFLTLEPSATLDSVPVAKAVTGATKAPVAGTGATNGVSPGASPGAPAVPPPGTADDPGPILLAAWETVAQARGEVSLSNLVIEVQRRAPALTPQTYGHTKLAQLIKQRVDLFAIRPDEANPAHQVVRRVKGQTMSGAREPIEVLLLAAWERAPKQDGWLFTGLLGHQLKQLDPAFDPKQYGHSRLGLLLQAHPHLFELRERSKGQYDVRRRLSGRTL